MTWFFLSIVTTLSFAIVNIVDKFLLNKYVKSPQLGIKILGLASISIALIFYFLFPQDAAFSKYLLFLAVPAGFLEALYIFFYLKAIEGSDIAYLIPIFSLAPLFIAIFSAIFFKEAIQLIPFIGILIIISGIILLMISRNGRLLIRKDKYFLFMLVATILFAAHSIFLDVGLENFSINDNLLFSRIGVFIGAVFCTLLSRSYHKKDFGTIQSYFFIISEILYLVTIYLFLLSLEKGNIIYVTGIGNMQPLFVFIISLFLSKYNKEIFCDECSFRYRSLAFCSIVIVVVGSFLVNF